MRDDFTGRYDTRPLLPHEDSPLWLVALIVVALVVLVLPECPVEPE